MSHRLLCKVRICIIYKNIGTLNEFVVPFRHNKLSNFRDLDQLIGLRALTFAYLDANPWSASANYRSIVLHTLPQLESLDSTPRRAVVRISERQEAAGDNNAEAAAAIANVQN